MIQKNSRWQHEGAFVFKLQRTGHGFDGWENQHHFRVYSNTIGKDHTANEAAAELIAKRLVNILNRENVE
jgi:hypothetical protein